ncbi:hypothetical protein DEO72_LG10g1179 [Vigna unguiculata]|uniref:Uncharacterized protein n=1 Tax=Vigna unguiculata TaxID=3917 RepID=A0A4D6N871_VIGUN|nr:hypothetical protein DEO72_LG10g1179 [Vigna unguiculata]
MLFRATTQGIPRALPPLPSHNSRDTFRATTQGTPAPSPLKHYQKPCSTPYEVQQLGHTASKPPSGGHVPLGATASRPPGGGHVPPGAKRLNKQSLQPPPGGTVYTARRTLFQGSRISSPSPSGTPLAARRLLHQNPTVASLPPGGPNSVARRRISTYAVLVLVNYSSHLALTPILKPLYS